MSVSKAFLGVIGGSVLALMLSSAATVAFDAHKEHTDPAWAEGAREFDKIIKSESAGNAFYACANIDACSHALAYQNTVRHQEFAIIGLALAGGLIGGVAAGRKKTPMPT